MERRSSSLMKDGERFVVYTHVLHSLVSQEEQEAALVPAPKGMAKVNVFLNLKLRCMFDVVL